MGAGSSSSFSSLTSNELLKRFVGTEVITYNDPYWNTLLSFASRVPRTSGDSRLLDESIQPLYSELVHHTPTTGNLATLVTVFLTRAVELDESARCDNDVFVWQTHNALFMVRIVIKLLLEHCTEARAIELLHATAPGSSSPPSLPPGRPVLPLLLHQVCRLLQRLPVSPSTHALHLEAVTLLTVALSSHVCVRSQPTYLVYRTLQRACADTGDTGGGGGAVGVVQALLQHVIVRPPPPPPTDQSGSFVAGLAAGLWSMLTLGLSGGDGSPEEAAGATDSSRGAGGRPQPAKPVPPSPLADHSLLLLLALTTHATGATEHQQQAAADNDNIFRKALFTAINDSSLSSKAGIPNGTIPPGAPEKTDTAADGGVVKISYSALFDALNLTLHTEHTTLLLYLILHNNVAFRTYLLSVSSVECLVVPLLHSLHCAQHLSSHHVYMALIVILMLTEDTAFNAGLHDIPLPTVPWYSDRPVSNLALGDLLILVLIRTITYNITKMRDRYLHSNCLAALANMSSQVRCLHGYVCQRLVGLLETLARRHARILADIRHQGTTVADDNLNQEEADIRGDELLSDLAVVEEVLRMVLEIVNSSLTHQLNHNPQLLYTLLYKRHVFLPFATQPNFSDICMNIDVVLNYLMNKLEKTTSDPSVADVQRVIEEGVLQLPKDRLRKFPELKFKYVEESSPEEFFIPYVWTLVYQSSGLYWAPDSVALFDPSGQDT